MPRRTDIDDEWDDEADDFEPDTDEQFDASENDDDDDTVPCPYCNRPIYEGAERCPFCEHYISEEDSPAQAKPWWIGIGLLACFLIVLMWILSGW